LQERVDMLREVTKHWEAVEVDVFEGLLVDYARKRGAGVILRGIRAVSDYEYELQMALMNRALERAINRIGPDNRGAAAALENLLKCQRLACQIVSNADRVRFRIEILCNFLNTVDLSIPLCSKERLWN